MGDTLIDKVEKFEDIDKFEGILFSHKIKGERHELTEINYGTNAHPIILYYCNRCKNYFRETVIKRVVSIRYKGSKAMQEADRKKRIAEIKKELMI
jgi:hypothetical protein